jgi:hypothetical protein
MDSDQTVSQLLRGLTPETLDAPTLKRLLAGLSSSPPLEQVRIIAFLNPFRDVRAVRPSRSFIEAYRTSMALYGDSDGGPGLDVLCLRAANAAAGKGRGNFTYLLLRLASALAIHECVDHYGWDILPLNLPATEAVRRACASPSSKLVNAASLLRAAATPVDLAYAAAFIRRELLPRAASRSSKKDLESLRKVEEILMSALVEGRAGAEPRFQSDIASTLCAVAQVFVEVDLSPSYGAPGRPL